MRIKAQLKAQNLCNDIRIVEEREFNCLDDYKAAIQSVMDETTKNGEWLGL